jgi:hypothetical protein
MVNFRVCNPEQKKINMDGPARNLSIERVLPRVSLIRPALDRLGDQAAAGAFSRLYVHSPDRLARRYAYQVLLIDELQNCGVEIVFLNRQLNQGPVPAIVDADIFDAVQEQLLENKKRHRRACADAKYLLQGWWSANAAVLPCAGRATSNVQDCRRRACAALSSRRHRHDNANAARMCSFYKICPSAPLLVVANELNSNTQLPHSVLAFADVFPRLEQACDHRKRHRFNPQTPFVR